MNAGITALFNQIADGLADQSFAIIDQFLSREETAAILQGDEFVNHKLHFRKAGIGKTDKQIIEEVRGDYIQWIDPAQASPGERVYLNRLRDLTQFLNQALFLSLKDVEIHRTVYPVGTRYQRHLDQFKSDDHRKLSVICYLNQDWTTEHGGQLRLHLDSGTLDILPEGGRLVIFRSDLIEHEVLPATRERYSITGWATDRAPELLA
jgi:SM-20-related protein